MDDNSILTALLTSNSNQLSNASIAALPNVVTAPSLASSLHSSSIDRFLDGAKVDEKTKDCVDKLTKESLAVCRSYNGFKFDTIQVYARPISGIGTHNASKDDYVITEEENKQNAQKAASGYHHALIILSGGHPEPIQYLLDRVEGVRFVKKDIVISELISGHLILIKEYTNISLDYEDIVEPFILSESTAPYNVVNNNCLKIVYNFIDGILKRNEWNNFEDFWNFIRSNFDKKDIECGKYNKQQNDIVKYMSKQNLLYQQKIRLIDDKQRRASWKIGDKVMIKSTNFKAKQSWFVGKIENIENNYVRVEYVKIGNTFYEHFAITNTYIMPYIKISSSFLDPITNKIMTKPVQILQSGMVYDEITVKYIQHLGFKIDPITAAHIGNRPVAVGLDVLQNKIQKFRSTHQIAKELINDEDSLCDKIVWDNIDQKLMEKCDPNTQQKLIYGKSVTMFYPENESKVSHDEKTDDHKANNNDDDDEDEDEDEDDDDDDYNEDVDILKWNTDILCIDHTSIPMITCMGPSRIGKSFLFNELLRNQPNWKKDTVDVFATSDSANVPQTKGAWITLYGDVETKIADDEQVKHDEIALIDSLPEDDITMWSHNDVLNWLTSLNPNFSVLFGTFYQYIVNHKINGRQLEISNDIEFLSNKIGLKPERAKLLKDVLDKRLRKKMDEIDSNIIDKMYLIDMEGLSHGVTKFTKKIFQGCYAISNVVLWFDENVMSDKFVKLMKKLKENMKIIANSNRKPAFIYILRNGDLTQFDFQIDDEEEDELDYYIKNNKSFQWFRDMNMFSSIHGYLLDSPQNLKRKKGKKKKPIHYDNDTLLHLMNKIKTISMGTCRFANNSVILNEQINNINQNDQLSVEKRIALCNSRLKWFVFSRKDSKKKTRQIKNAVIVCNYDLYEVDRTFKIGYKSLNQQLKLRHLPITLNFSEELESNKNEIIKEIKRIQKQRDEDKKSVGTTTTVAGVGTVGCVAGLFLVSNPIGWAALCGGGVVCGAVAVGGYFWKPKKLDKLLDKGIEMTMQELVYYGG